MKINGCYANSLDNCGGKLSNDHIISQCVLGDFMETSFNNNTQIIGKSRFKIKILCSVHNSELSKYENDWKSFQLWLAEDATFYGKIQDSPEVPIPRKFNISGKSLENWLLKTAIAYSFYIHGKKTKLLNLPYIVKRLYNLAEFEFPFGLSYFHTKTERTHEYPGCIFLDYHFDNDEIYGITINFQGIFFFICLPTENSHRITRVGVNLQGDIYYPVSSLDDEFFDENRLLLVWHSNGIRRHQFNANKVAVERSTVYFDW